MLKNIIIEGIDRVGKGTLISSLENELGFMQYLHYEKPKKLDRYDGPDQLYQYQRASFSAMFKLLESQVPFILDRAHIGEIVYSKRYRGYDGGYVLDMERGYPWAMENTLLVLLCTSTFDIIKDDGLSFDFSKKGEEQDDFIASAIKSNIKHKLIINVAARESNVPEFVPKRFITDLVLRAYNNPRQFEGRSSVSWFKKLSGYAEDIQLEPVSLPT